MAPHLPFDPQVLTSVNSLIGALFLLSAFVLMSTRQVQGFLRIFVLQSLLLAISAFVLGCLYQSWDLIAVAGSSFTAQTLGITPPETPPPAPRAPRGGSAPPSPTTLWSPPGNRQF
jgi:hypothetical protein